MKRKLTGLTLMLAALNATGPLFSHAETASTEIRISGTVQAGSGCVINNNQPITVEFGRVNIDEINGFNYLQPVPFTMNCNEIPSNSMRIQVTGTISSFHPSLLATTKANLGIAFYDPDDYNLAVNNSWYSFTYPDVPKITAAPYKRRNATLTSGDFTATALLVIELQ
ncbi:fimbrial protein [Pantoea dispersa]|uniref:Fimbrial protein n=1 Tax=Pantoea dispersa TaxID=59814 RepID=A0ABY2ZUN8_9GAMM|nr:fimbrial protein [Pantoea dispersa]TQC70245.1 fimbrial protein [Pantoea dispersa]